ncbi:MAG: ribose 5-phosphate isomerase B [Planctomycetaceae bacterium]|nr:ribose 5-phosphate isomerase B [Planctomycetaceae bacterium]
MKIGIASDHRGLQMKNRLLQLLGTIEEVTETRDFGPDDTVSVDYPDYASRVASAVSTGEVDRGILICGTGIGMCITANKFCKVRAATCHDIVTAEYSRLHNDTNVLCLSADQLSDQLADQIVRIWLRTEFEEGRHARRLLKITEIEKQNASVSGETGNSCC